MTAQQLKKSGEPNDSLSLGERERVRAAFSISNCIVTAEGCPVYRFHAAEAAASRPRRFLALASILASILRRSLSDPRSPVRALMLSNSSPTFSTRTVLSLSSFLFAIR